MKKPILIIIAGPNGSGKTTITSKILKHEWVLNCKYINPDNIALDKFGDWNDKENVLNAAIYATKLRELCIENGESLIFETVFSTQEKIEFIKKAKVAGYFIRLFFVSTNHPSINASRIARRILSGGHDVPITKVISRYEKSIANCCSIVNLVDRLYVYDNSVDFEEARLLFKVKDKTLLKTYNEINEWALPIYESLD